MLADLLQTLFNRANRAFKLVSRQYLMLLNNGEGHTRVAAASISISTLESAEAL